MRARGSDFVNLLFNPLYLSLCVCPKSLRLCLTLCDSMDYSPPGFFVHGILQARILEWVAKPSSIFSTEVVVQPESVNCLQSEVAQSCPTPCDPMNCSPPGSSVHGILQARILEWLAISCSRGSSRPRDRTRVSRIGAKHFNL